MIYTPLTKEALQICFETHKDQLDKAGAPYVFHPFHLAGLRHNSDLSRLDTPSEADRARVAKYAQALELLEAME